MAHASYVETATLMDLWVDPGYFGAVVRYLTGPDSRVVLQEGHLSGLDLLANDIIRAALVPRQQSERRSTFALHTVDALAQLQETAEEGGYLYDQTLGLAFMRRTARNARLSPEVQDRAAAHLARYSEETLLALKSVLKQSGQQDDSRAYTSEVWVEEWFGEVHTLVYLTLKANRLLDATEPANKGARRAPVTIIPDGVRSELQQELNRGVGYLCECSSLPPFGQDPINLLFLNLQSYFCLFYQSRHLVGATRAHVERFTREVALDLADTLTGNYELDEDLIYHLGEFAKYEFLDLYFPGIVAELQACRNEWLRLRDEYNRRWNETPGGGATG